MFFNLKNRLIIELMTFDFYLIININYDFREIEIKKNNFVFMPSFHIQIYFHYSIFYRGKKQVKMQNNEISLYVFFETTTTTINK